MFFNGTNKYRTNDNPLVISDGGFFCFGFASKDDVQNKASQATAISV